MLGSEPPPLSTPPHPSPPLRTSLPQVVQRTGSKQQQQLPTAPKNGAAAPGEPSPPIPVPLPLLSQFMAVRAAPGGEEGNGLAAGGGCGGSKPLAAASRQLRQPDSPADHAAFLRQTDSTLSHTTSF